MISARSASEDEADRTKVGALFRQRIATENRHLSAWSNGKLVGIAPRLPNAPTSVFAADFNRDNALAMYAKAMKGLSALIGEQDDPLLIHGRGSSTFYQVQIGTNTRREADDLCHSIRHAGGACLVKRNKVEGSWISQARGHAARRVHSHVHLR